MNGRGDSLRFPDRDWRSIGGDGNGGRGEGIRRNRGIGQVIFRGDVNLRKNWCLYSI